MQLPHRMKRHAVLRSSTTGPPSKSMSQPPSDTTADPPATFDDWLDGRLRTLYQTVVNEPLPPEILDLLKEVEDPK